MERSGYRRNWLKSQLFILGCIITLGLLYMITKLKQNHRIYLTCSRCQLKEAEIILPDNVPGIGAMPGLKPRDLKYGNLNDIKETGDFHLFLTKLHKKCGPIVKFYFGPTVYVSTCTPDLFRQQLKVFDRPHEIHEFLKNLMGKDSILFANGEMGQRRHAAYRRCFSDQNISKLFPLFQEVADDIISKWEKIPKFAHIGLREHVQNYAIRVVLRTAFGSYFNDENKIADIGECNDLCVDEIENHLKGNYLEEGTERYQEFEKKKARLRQLVLESAKYRKQTERNIDDPVLLIDVINDLDITDAQRQADMMNLVIGGIHTSVQLFVTVLTFAIYNLAKNKKIQERLCEEINTNIGDATITREGLSQLPYLWQITQETLRASNLVAFAARSDNKDSVLGGYLIPAGTGVIQALGVASENPSYFPNPQMFDPDRFSQENIKSFPRLAFQPFGFAGQRKCLGYKLGESDTMVLLANLVRKFKMDLVPGQNLEKVYGFVTGLSDNVWLTVFNRKSA